MGLDRHALALACTLALFSAAAPAEGPKSAGQLLFVPVYSELAYGDRKHTLNLSVTLSIRNTDRQSSLKLKRVDYFSSSGTLVRAYLSAPQTIAPLAAAEYVITGGDRSGGTAASFLVEWESAARISVPVVEAVMVSAASMHGVSFQSAARVLDERN